MMIPAKEDNPSGLHQRYRVTKANKEHGERDDPNAVYLVLRLDKAGDDVVWTQLCRDAAVYLAQKLLMQEHLPQVAKDIIQLVRDLERL